MCLCDRLADTCSWNGVFFWRRRLSHVIFLLTVSISVYTATFCYRSVDSYVWGPRTTGKMERNWTNLPHDPVMCVTWSVLWCVKLVLFIFFKLVSFLCNRHTDKMFFVCYWRHSFSWIENHFIFLMWRKDENMFFKLIIFQLHFTINLISLLSFYGKEWSKSLLHSVGVPCAIHILLS